MSFEYGTLFYVHIHLLERYFYACLAQLSVYLFCRFKLHVPEIGCFHPNAHLEGETAAAHAGHGYEWGKHATLHDAFIGSDDVLRLPVANGPFGMMTV